MSYSDYYTQQRVRSFRQRKGISQANNFQGLVMAILIVVGLFIMWDFVSAQRDLTSAQVEYVTTVETQ